LREGERMMAEVRTHLADLRCPLLVIHARDDEITRFDSVRRLFDSLPQSDKELVVLNNSYHMVTIDNDRHEVAAALDRFVKGLANRETVSATPLDPPCVPFNRPAIDPAAHLNFNAT